MNILSDDCDDADLLAGITNGDHGAFTLLVKRHTQRFYRLAWRFMGSAAEAEDVVQDAFLKLWQHPGTWQMERNARFTTWFHRVVVNLCLDRKKKATALPLPETLQIADTRPGPQQETMEAHTARALEAAIRQLPERQMTAINLCFGEEALSNQEWDPLESTCRHASLSIL